MAKVPLPANSGDVHRNWALLRSARSVASRLDLLSLPQPGSAGTEAGLVQVQELCDSVTVVGRPVGELLGSPVNRIRTVAGRPHYHSVGNAGAIRREVRRLLADTDYDVVVLSQLFLGSALPPEVLGRTIYDTHNVHHLRLAESLSDVRVLPVAVRDRITRNVLAQEARLLASVATCVACSEVDAAAFRSICPQARVEVIANGTDIPETMPGHDPAGRPLFLASLDASANVDGLRYLVDEVLPLLRSDIRIDVAGSNARPAVHKILQRAGDRVSYLGQVHDPRATMSSSLALLVPLLTGGGTRLKVLEAFAVGLPVISTSKGIEGIPAVADRDAVVADAPARFAAAISALVDDPARGVRLAEAAHRLVRAQFDWNALGARFAALLTDVGVPAPPDQRLSPAAGNGQRFPWA